MQVHLHNLEAVMHNVEVCLNGKKWQCQSYVASEEAAIKAVWQRYPEATSVSIVVEPTQNQKPDFYGLYNGNGYLPRQNRH